MAGRTSVTRVLVGPWEMNGGNLMQLRDLA